MNKSQFYAISWSYRNRANEKAKEELENNYDLELLNKLYPKSSYVAKLNYAQMKNSKYAKAKEE